MAGFSRPAVATVIQGACVREPESCHLDWKASDDDDDDAGREGQVPSR